MRIVLGLKLWKPGYINNEGNQIDIKQRCAHISCSHAWHLEPLRVRVNSLACSSPLHSLTGYHASSYPPTALSITSSPGSPVFSTVCKAISHALTSIHTASDHPGILRRVLSPTHSFHINVLLNVMINSSFCYPIYGLFDFNPRNSPTIAVGGHFVDNKISDANSELCSTCERRFPHWLLGVSCLQLHTLCSRIYLIAWCLLYQLRMRHTIHLWQLHLYHILSIW